MPKLVDLNAEIVRWENGDETPLMKSIVSRMKLISPAVAFDRKPRLILKAALYMAVETARRVYGAENAMTEVQAALNEIKDAALTEPVV
jgi:hypothetical protein